MYNKSYSNLRSITAALFICCLPLSAQTILSGNISDGAGGPLLTGTVYHATAQLTVPTGTTLTVQAGAIIKFTVSNGVQVNGTMNVTASLGTPAIFTRIEDDTAGGDTNGDGGATTPSPSTWTGIRYATASGSGLCKGMEVRYTGASGVASIRYSGTGPVTLCQCKFSDYGASAIDLGQSGLPVIDSCIFENGDVPGKNIPIEAIPLFSGNSATGNTNHNLWAIKSASVQANQSIAAANMMNGAFLLDDDLFVDGASTLTVGAGVVFKASGPGISVNTDGTLICNGTNGSRVVFTDFADDSVAGDSNNDGPSTGTPGAWRGLDFRATTVGSVLTHTLVSYSGNIGRAGIEVNGGADPTMTDCSVTNCSADGVTMNTQLNSAVFTNCNFDSNDRAVDSVHIENVSNFHNCTANSNSTSNGIRVSSTTLISNQNIDGSNMVGGAVELGASLSIPTGFTLTLGAGAIFKFAGSGQSCNVSGTLIANGTAGNPVVFTSFDDDSHGGDTNANGPTSGSVSSHRGLDFSSAATGCILNHVVVRYSGNLSRPGIRCTSTSPTIMNSVVEDCSDIGIDLLGGSMPTISNCNIDRCSIPLATSTIEAIAGFANNSASGNSTYDAVRNSGSTVGANLSISPFNLIGGVLVNTVSTNIPAGVRLTLNANVVMKYTSAAHDVQVSGDLEAFGSAGNEVVFTVFADDAHGGNTNKDGAATLPTPGSWRGLILLAGPGTMTIDHAMIRYSGNIARAGVTLTSGNISLTNSTIDNCSAAGVNFNTGDFSPSIRNCAINNCERSMANMRITSLKNLRDNTAVGNSTYNSPFVSSAAIGIDDVIHARALIDDVLIVSGSLTVSNSTSLRIEAGCILKFINNTATINATGGTMQLLGTGLEPIILTKIDDDESGGDTNIDGPSSGTPATWRGIQVGLSATALGQVEFVKIRFAGNLSLAAFSCSAPGYHYRSIRVEHCGASGFLLAEAAQDVDNLVAFDCVDGIDLNSGNFNVRHATVTGCIGVGIKVGVSFTGIIQNSISYGNTTNFTGATASNLFSSNGDTALAGVNGNLDTDPVFLDDSLAVGNLFLDSTSPCVGTADFFVSLFVASDHTDSTRMADDDLDGSALSDMGAYERAPYFMVFAGRPVLGETMTFAMLGRPGIGFLYVGLLNGVPTYFHPYGMYLAGAANDVFLELPVSANFGFPIVFPNDPSFIGNRFGIQMVGAELGNLGVGSFTNVYRGLIMD